MIQYITPYWGPLVFESQIDKEHHYNKENRYKIHTNGNIQRSFEGRFVKINGRKSCLLFWI